MCPQLRLKTSSTTNSKLRRVCLLGMAAYTRPCYCVSETFSADIEEGSHYMNEATEVNPIIWHLQYH
jgi:hypothetical protein